MFFTVELLNAKVAVEVDCESLAGQLINQFSATKATVTKHSYRPRDVKDWVRTHRFGSYYHTKNENWRPTIIHCSRKCETSESKPVLVSGPPISVTVAGNREIDVLRCDAEADLGHLHHMVKYPLRAQLEKDENILVHASGVRLTPQFGVLFVGGSGAGKTTMMVELSTLGLSALGNDSIMLSNQLKTETVLATPWPHVLRLGEGTINHNNVLRTASGKSSWRRGADGKAELYFDTLNEVFDTELVKGPAIIRAIVEMRIDLESDVLEMEHLSRDAAEEAIDAWVVRDRFQTGWLPGWEWAESGEAVRIIANTLLNSVQVYRLLVGIRAKHWPARVSGLLEEVESSGSFLSKAVP